MFATAGRNALRNSLEGLMRNGLHTEWRQRAYSDSDISSVLHELEALPPRDHVGRLRVAGFTPDPFRAEEPGTDAGIEQSCHTCMLLLPSSRVLHAPGAETPRPRALVLPPVAHMNALAQPTATSRDGWRSAASPIVRSW